MEWVSPHTSRRQKLVTTNCVRVASGPGCSRTVFTVGVTVGPFGDTNSVTYQSFPIHCPCTVDHFFCFYVLFFDDVLSVYLDEISDIQFKVLCFVTELVNCIVDGHTFSQRAFYCVEVEYDLIDINRNFRCFDFVQRHLKITFIWSTSEWNSSNGNCKQCHHKNSQFFHLCLKFCFFCFLIGRNQSFY